MASQRNLKNSSLRNLEKATNLTSYFFSDVLQTIFFLGNGDFKMASEVSKDDFEINDFVVYPSHGVGRIVDEEIQNVAGFELKMYVLTFEKDKMTLKVPKDKIESTGMRKLSSPNTIGKALQVIGGKAKVKRAMWSRRAQDYEQKINSGELILIAEVVRDLHRNDEQREQSYSERQLYEAALERLTREIAAVDGVEERKAQEKVDKVLDGKAA